MGTGGFVRYYPEGKDDPDCFKKAIRAIPHPACAIVAVPDNLHKKVAAARLKMVYTPLWLSRLSQQLKKRLN